MKQFEICPVRYKSAAALMNNFLKRPDHPYAPTLASIKQASYWAFCVHAQNGQAAQIHYWAAPKIPKSVVVGMFAHELYHLAGHHDEAPACEVQAIAGFAEELAEDHYEGH